MKNLLIKVLMMFSMNLNSLRNLLTLVFGVGGIGLNAIFPHLNPMWGVVIALWVRAGMDQFWPASGITTDWKNSLRNFLTVLVASGEVLHQYLPFMPPASCVTLSLMIRAGMDQIWPATQDRTQIVETAPVKAQAVQASPFTALSDAKAKMESTRPPDAKGKGFEVRGNAILRVDEKPK